MLEKMYDIVLRSNKLYSSNLELNKLDISYHLQIYNIDFKNELGKFVEFDDKFFAYHPVFYSQRIIKNGLVYLNSGNKEYLYTAEKYFDKLMSGAEVSKYGHYIFPYPFEFYFTERMKPNWYSGMAQGQVLSALSVLYKIKPKAEYIKIAKNILSTFLYLKEYNNPWFTLVDQDNYFWIEEYPSKVPNHVLNGFIFSVLGVYDALVNIPLNDEEINLCSIILNSSFKTLIDKFPNFIDRKGLSYYSIGKPYFSQSYHIIHCIQAWILYNITKNEKFLYYFNIMRNARKYCDLRGWLANIKHNIKQKLLQFKNRVICFY